MSSCISQQDRIYGALCVQQSPTAALRNTQLHLCRELWPTNSSELKPIAYMIQGVTQQQEHESQVNKIEEINQRLVEVCKLAIMQRLSA